MNPRTLIPLAAATLLAACGGPESTAPVAREEPGPPVGFGAQPEIALPEPAPAITGDGTLAVAEITFSISEAWVQETPTSQMRLAQCSLPGEAGPAEMNVFCFGPSQGGPVQANIDRWVGQFTNPDVPGGEVQSEVNTFETGGLTVTTVQAQGNHTPTAMGPFAPPQAPIADAALFGVIVAGGPQGTVFVKVTGPRTTVEAHGEALQAFAESAALGS